MKLKNKLLPFIGVSTLVATVAPIALTSCKTKTTSSGIDLRDWYTPTIEKHAYDKLSYDEVQNLYFRGDEEETQEWMDEDEMIERLTQDYLFGSSLYVQSLNNSTLSLSANSLHTYTQNMSKAHANNVYFELLGIPEVKDVYDATPLPSPGTGSLNLGVSYSKYNVNISDVRVGHMVNYYPYIESEGEIDPVEYTTMSMELGFDIEYTSTGNSLGNIGITFNDGTLGTLTGSTTSTQSHKGTISLVNVPVTMWYQECSELDGSYAWTMNLDYYTVEQTELTRRVPFSIDVVDNVSYTTTTTSSAGNSSGSTAYEKNYYSNMPWENELDEDEYSETLQNAQKAYKVAYKKAIQYAEEQGWSEAVAVAYAKAQGNAAKNEIIVPVAVPETLSYINEKFFYIASYYLFSITEKIS